MSDKLLMNQITEKWLSAYIQRPSAALFIDTPDDTIFGVKIANHLYGKLVSNPKSPLIILDEQDKKSIGIDDVRGLQKSLSLTANISDGISRIAVVTKTELLTPEAQNALLKMIEELPERTLLFLVCSNKESVLETVISRCFLLPVLPLEEHRAMKHADENSISLADAIKAYSLSEGRATLFEEMLSDENAELLKEVELAKNFMKSSVFDRQRLLKKVLDKDHDVNAFLRSLRVITKSGMRNAENIKQKNRWKTALESVLLAEAQLKSNVSAKLVLLSLSVSA